MLIQSLKAVNISMFSSLNHPLRQFVFYIADIVWKTSLSHRLIRFTLVWLEISAIKNSSCLYLHSNSCYVQAIFNGKADDSQPFIHG